jgi:carbamoyl-phosphate synthase large subunit
MVFLSLNAGDKPAGLVVAKRLRELGLGIAATTGTAAYLAKFNQPVDRVVGKLSEMEGSVMDNAAELVAQGEISFVVNTPHGRGSREDGEAIRKAANSHRVPSVTTVEAALAAVNGLCEQSQSEVEVCSLQEYHAR